MKNFEYFFLFGFLCSSSKLLQTNGFSSKDGEIFFLRTVKELGACENSAICDLKYGF